MSELTKAPPRGFLDMARDFRRDQPIDFMATEFLINPDVFDAVESHPDVDTKLMRAVRATRAHLSRAGFHFSGAPSEVARAMTLLRREVLSAADEEEAALLIHRALLVEDLPAFQDLKV